MKTNIKSILAVAALSSVVTVHAEIIDTGKRFDNNGFNFLFEKFSNTREVNVVSEFIDDETNVTTFTLYDNNFDEVKTFSTPSYQTVTSQYTRAEGIQAPVNIFERYRDDNVWIEPITKDAFIQACAEDGYTIVENRGDEVWCLNENPYEYFYYECYQYEYPHRLRVWKDGTSYSRYIEYDHEGWGYTGKYGEPRVEFESATPSPKGMDPYDGTCADYNRIRLTQTLFNNDDYYEWMIPVYEAIDCSYTTEYEKVEGERIYCIGFKVESESGSVVAEINAPAGYVFYDYYPDLFIMNQKSFLIIEMHDLGRTSYFYGIYEIDSENASVKMVGAPHRVSVNPTTPRRGTLVNVDLGNPANEGCKIVVTSTSGRTVMTKAVEPGSMGTTIDTARFERGMYIVTVTDGKTIRENTKIIIR